MVDFPNGRLEWEIHNQFGARLTLITDASKKGWGAVWGTRKCQGLWKKEETLCHINVLELKGALFAVRTFCKDMRDIHVHLKMDNRSAVAYIQKMGGTKSQALMKVTQEIWEFCLERQIILTSEYLPGKMNVEADWQSRNFRDSSDWQLKESVFHSLNKIWGPFCLDLFASRHNTQLDSYISWKPDPFALGVDAFQRTWTERDCTSSIHFR